MNIVLTVSVVAVFAAVCGVLLKRSGGEIAVLFSLAAAVLIFLYILPEVRVLSESVRLISENEALSGILGVLIKALGIVLTARIAVQLCRDAGESALASGVEFAAKTAVMLLLVPLLQQLMGLIEDILVL